VSLLSSDLAILPVMKCAYMYTYTYKECYERHVYNVVSDEMHDMCICIHTKSVAKTRVQRSKRWDAAADGITAIK
jgi:hypothetical protein